MLYRILFVSLIALALGGLLACGDGGSTSEPAKSSAEVGETPAVESLAPVGRVPGGTHESEPPLEGVQPSGTDVPEPPLEGVQPTAMVAPVMEPTVMATGEDVEKKDFQKLVEALLKDNQASENNSRNEGKALMQQSAGSGTLGVKLGAQGSPSSSGGFIPPEAGGEANPNAGELPLVYFENYGVNPFVDADEDNLSTFALDGDTASYGVGKSYLERGWLPEPDSVRVEEWVNSFSQGYVAPDEGVALALDGGPSRFGEEGYRMLRVGVAASQPTGEREAVSLVFVLDVSGSMEADGRLGLAKAMMMVLADSLTGIDRVALVTYGDVARVRHEFGSGDDTETLEATIRGIHAGGSTYVEDGIRKAYEIAEPEMLAGRDVRLVLFSDGVGNVGHTGAEGILALIDNNVKKDATLTSVGVGFTGNYNDVMLEVLANRGNGTYHYVQDSEAAGDFLERHGESIFREVARDARIQVEFNPDAVRKYRLLGYENRAVSNEDFRDDTLDFGEIGFTNDVTALYEIRLQDGVADSAVMAIARLRWLDVESDSFKEIEKAIEVGDLAGEWSEMGSHLRRSAAVAEFAELMGRSFWAQCGTVSTVSEALVGVDNEDGGDEELLKLLDAAAAQFEPYCQT